VIPTRRLYAGTGPERLFAAVDGSRRACVTFEAHPSFGVADEPTQLLEQGVGGSAVPLERLDSLEAFDHCAGLVHANDRSGSFRTGM
jgi:hypothetical protein